MHLFIYVFQGTDATYLQPRRHTLNAGDACSHAYTHISYILIGTPIHADRQNTETPFLIFWIQQQQQRHWHQLKKKRAEKFAFFSRIQTGWFEWNFYHKEMTPFQWPIGISSGKSMANSKKLYIFWVNCNVAWRHSLLWHHIHIYMCVHSVSSQSQSPLKHLEYFRVSLSDVAFTFFNAFFSRSLLIGTQKQQQDLPCSRHIA